MLSKIQQLLADIYDLQPDLDVKEFVCGREVAQAALGPDVPIRGELLLVVEDADGVHVGLYVDPAAIEVLRSTQELPLEELEAFCLATEGVSHFLYLTFRAAFESCVSQLELEFQAEVDKYAAGLLAGNGVGAIRERSRILRRRLYDDVKFIDAADSAEGERYRMANRWAAQYTADLEARYVSRGAVNALALELRRFYRLDLQSKLDFMRAGHRAQ